MHWVAMPRVRPASGEFVQQRDRDAAACGTDRMAQRAGAAVDIDFVVADADIFHRRHRDDGEGLIDFIEVDVVGRPALCIDAVSSMRRRAPL